MCLSCSALYLIEVWAVLCKVPQGQLRNAAVPSWPRTWRATCGVCRDLAITPLFRRGPATWLMSRRGDTTMSFSACLHTHRPAHTYYSLFFYQQIKPEWFLSHSCFHNQWPGTWGPWPAASALPPHWHVTCNQPQVAYLVLLTGSENGKGAWWMVRLASEGSMQETELRMADLAVSGFLRQCSMSTLAWSRCAVPITKHCKHRSQRLLPIFLDDYE